MGWGGGDGVMGKFYLGVLCQSLQGGDMQYQPDVKGSITRRDKGTEIILL